MGAEHDPRAPWNQLHEYCPYCDSREMEIMASEAALDKAKEANKTITNPADHMSEDDFYDDCYQEIYDESRLCAQCYLEENEDDWREDI
jgi:hypothetical protein